MKQLYYTQCPIGYGLGASNGFQIKRLTPDYAITGDFRHLGFRAFLPGTRTIAPSALRYRRDDRGWAEVAWLTPRSHEYQTERGSWGRPGGHFAHGLQLDEDELRAIAEWPAGLYARPFWIQSDPSPTHGQPPAPLELSATQLRCPPVFDSVVSLTRNVDPGVLARLLTAVAQVAREGRTLFLIDQPQRLADIIALLTFALPSPWRGALTFSTYHDRPEELPGFRIQGTISAARPNRQAMLSQGIVADLEAGTWEPALEPRPWATTLASWLVRGSDRDREAWDATARRARVASDSAAPDAIWTDPWLDELFGLDGIIADRLPPGEGRGWSDLAGSIRWAGAAGLLEEFLRTHPPAWWAGSAIVGPERRQALGACVGDSAAWTGEGAPTAWGAVLAQWTTGCSQEDRVALLETALSAAPAAGRPSFVTKLVASLSSADAAVTIRWLRSHPACDSALLLPLELSAALSAAVERREKQALRSIIGRALGSPSARNAVLEFLAQESTSHRSRSDLLAEEWALALEGADRRVVAEVIRWGLQRPEASAYWLHRHFRRMFAASLNDETWSEIQGRIPSSLQPSLAATVLAVASDADLRGEAFRWGVEKVLLPLPESDRPHDPGWPGTYIDRTPSDLDLLRKLHGRDARTLGLRPWLDQARVRGELSPRQEERLTGCADYVRALKSGDARSLFAIRLPVVAADERGTLLGQILGHLENDTAEQRDIALEVCRQAWPGGFEAGAPGLQAIAQALDQHLSDGPTDPGHWFVLVAAILTQLQLDVADGAAFRPDGLAASIVAETVRRADAAIDPWRLRQFLLQHDAAWRILAEDVRRELEGQSIASGLESFELWDRLLVKGLHTPRFFELWMNVCDGPTLASVVLTRAEDLRSLGPLSWWSASAFAGARDDLRDAFARRAPLAPLPLSSLSLVQAWLRTEGTHGAKARTDGFPPRDDGGVSTADGVGPEHGPLSEHGRDRWRCLEALSRISASAWPSCWELFLNARKEIPVERLEADDCHRFAAWLLLRFESLDSVQVARLAKWLYERGVRDADRLGGWSEELAEVTVVPEATLRARGPMVADLRGELKNVIRDAEGRPEKRRGDNSN